MMTYDEFYRKLKRVTFKKVMNRIRNAIQFIYGNVHNYIETEKYYYKNRNAFIFTTDWFSNNIKPGEGWNKWLHELKNKPHLRVLEIGCYEGRATCWLLDNILTHPTARMICIDTLEGSVEHKEHNVNMIKVKRNFFHNIRRYGKKVKIFLDYSQQAIRKRYNVFHENSFDFIYIDGSHTAFDVLEDAVLCFRLLKKNGIMIFDDYEWKQYPEAHMNPQLAIDAWLACFKGQFELVDKGYQLCIRKV